MTDREYAAARAIVIGYSTAATLQYFSGVVRLAQQLDEECRKCSVESDGILNYCLQIVAGDTKELLRKFK